MGTDCCPKCGLGAGEAVLCFRCNGCAYSHCSCDASEEITRQIPGDPLTPEECDEGAHQQEQAEDRARRG